MCIVSANKSYRGIVLQFHNVTSYQGVLCVRLFLLFILLFRLRSENHAHCPILCHQL